MRIMGTRDVVMTSIAVNCTRVDILYQLGLEVT